MKAYLTLCFLCCWLLSCAQKPAYNIDAEELNPTTKMPKDWTFAFNDDQKKAYVTELDSEVKYSGKHSISVRNINSQTNFYAIDYPIFKVFEGKEIVLKGYIKTEDVKSGYAGLWMRIDGEQPTIAFDNMGNRGVKGNSEWKEYSIKLPYDASAARSIHIGGLLVGDGKAWFDKLELFIDDKPIESVLEKKPDTRKASLDTAFSSFSGVQPFTLTDRIQNNLLIAGQFWGFLKYHHPAIANGDYNWDAELFRYLPKIINAASNAQLSQTLEDWLDKLPATQPTTEIKSPSSKDMAFKPDYGKLMNGTVFSKSLTDKLTKVKNSKKPNSHYYLSYYQGVGNPKFENEKSYAKMTYPDAGYRLLSLYRYWSMINYFFPYKDVIGTDWNQILNNSIPDFVKAKDQQEYLLASLKLIASIHDTHANIWSSHPALEEFKGSYKLPLKAEFIENKLVVTGYAYGDTLGVKQKFFIGDVITEINGKPIETLIKHFLPYTAASNYDTQLRDLPQNFLLRGPSELFSLSLLREGKKITQTSNGLRANYYFNSNSKEEKAGFKLLDENTGYVFPGRYRNSDLPAIKKLFKNTTGIIIDMRCYPSEFMPFTFGNYLKATSTPFVKFTSSILDYPGQFTYSPPLTNGGDILEAYAGKVVVIVNSTSQSQAEYTTMAFQSSPNVTVIGSTTAGADGNVSQILLPGGISTMISGIGVFYPDGTPTQRVGVKIDHFLKPTIKGTIEGRDELLEKAKEILKNSPK
jgi:C-terminal processing protease CtpA/Prc